MQTMRADHLWFLLRRQKFLASSMVLGKRNIEIMRRKAFLDFVDAIHCRMRSNGQPKLRQTKFRESGVNRTTKDDFVRIPSLSPSRFPYLSFSSSIARNQCNWFTHSIGVENSEFVCQICLDRWSTIGVPQFAVDVSTSNRGLMQHKLLLHPKFCNR